MSFYNRLAEGAIIVALLSVLAFQWPRFEKYETEKAAILVICASILLALRIVRWRQTNWLLLHPLVLGVLLLTLSAALSTVFSFSPAQSFWGSAARANGLLTWLVCVLLFGEILLSGRRIWRVIATTLIVAALTLCVFFWLTRFDSEFWGTGASTPNHSVMASWLVMTFFAIGAVFVEQRFRRQRLLLASLLLLISLTIIVSESRGATLGLLTGGICMLAMVNAMRRDRKRQLVLIGIVGVVGLVYLLITASLHNTSGVPLFLQPRDPFRQEAWQAAVTLLTSADEPFLDASAQPDPFASLRLIVGYGLDGLEQTQIRFGVVGSGDKYLDRFHNHLYDAFAMQGLLGLAGWLIVFGGTIYLVLKQLKLIDPRSRLWWIMVEIAGAGAGIVLIKLLMPAGSILSYIVPGAGVGIIAGLFFWVIIYTFRQSISEGAASQNTALAALLCALIAHWIDIQFGFMRVTTEVLWWVLLGVVLAQARGIAVVRPVNLEFPAYSRIALAAGLLLINSLISTQIAAVEQDVMIVALASVVVIVSAIGGWAFRRKMHTIRVLPLGLVILGILLSGAYYCVTYSASALHNRSLQLAETNDAVDLLAADAGYRLAVRYTPDDPSLYLDWAYTLTKLKAEPIPGTDAEILNVLDTLLQRHPFYANTLNWQFFQTYYLEQTSPAS